MGETAPLIDPNTGFCSANKTFHSLHPSILLPPENLPISAASYAFSLRCRSLSPHSTVLIDSSNGRRFSFFDFTGRVISLATSLRHRFKLYVGDTAFILCPNLIQVPILYFSLLALGVAVSPANPAGADSEIARQIDLCKPAIAFATESTARKLPRHFRGRTVIVDSPEFDSLVTSPSQELGQVEVAQSDLAAIMYSSGTTGRVKAVMLTHRNLIALLLAYAAQSRGRAAPAVFLYTMPFFHMFGFFYAVKSMALGETVVVTSGRFDLGRMLRAVEEFRVTHIAASPPVVVAMAKGGAAVEAYDLRSLVGVGCGGAPLGKHVIAAFAARFPGVALTQVSSGEAG